MLAITEHERSADDAERCGDGRSSGRRSLLPAARAPTCQCRELGRERPRILAHRLCPRALTPGSLTPQLSICQLVGACGVHRLRSRRPPVTWVVARLARVVLETNLSVVQLTQSRLTSAVVCAAITHPSVELCSAPCKARRFAPPTRVSARGLRALTAPARSSPDCNCAMATPCIPSRS
jgi:hypothetical protein